MLPPLTTPLPIAPPPLPLVSPIPACVLPLISSLVHLSRTPLLFLLLSLPLLSYISLIIEQESPLHQNLQNQTHMITSIKNNPLPPLPTNPLPTTKIPLLTNLLPSPTKNNNYNNNSKYNNYNKNKLNYNNSNNRLLDNHLTVTAPPTNQVSFSFLFSSFSFYLALFYSLFIFFSFPSSSPFLSLFIF